MTADTYARIHADLIAAQRADVGRRFVELVAALKPLATELAALDAARRALEDRAHRRRQPDATQLAADVILGELAALRPHLPYASEPRRGPGGRPFDRRAGRPRARQADRLGSHRRKRGIVSGDAVAPLTGHVERAARVRWRLVVNLPPVSVGGRRRYPRTVRTVEASGKRAAERALSGWIARLEAGARLACQVRAIARSLGVEETSVRQALACLDVGAAPEFESDGVDETEER